MGWSALDKVEIPWSPPFSEGGAGVAEGVIRYICCAPIGSTPVWSDRCTCQFIVHVCDLIYSETSLKRPPKGPGNSGRYREVVRIGSVTLTYVKSRSLFLLI